MENSIKTNSTAEALKSGMTVISILDKSRMVSTALATTSSEVVMVGLWWWRSTIKMESDGSEAQ